VVVTSKGRTVAIATSAVHKLEDAKDPLIVCIRVSWSRGPVLSWLRLFGIRHVFDTQFIPALTLSPRLRSPGNGLTNPFRFRFLGIPFALV
jgi:hypothetical protein